MTDRRLALRSWTYNWLGVRFDAESGKGRFTVLGPAVWTCGVASRVAGSWHTLWSDGEALYFQSGRQRWIAGDGQTTLEEHEGLRTFRLEQRGITVFVVHYRSPASKLLNRLDPTYDSLDDELQDVFRYVARVWNDPTIQKGLVASAAKHLRP